VVLYTSHPPLVSSSPAYSPSNTPKNSLQLNFCFFFKLKKLFQSLTQKTCMNYSNLQHLRIIHIWNPNSCSHSNIDFPIHSLQFWSTKTCKNWINTKKQQWMNETNNHSTKNPNHSTHKIIINHYNQFTAHFAIYRNISKSVDTIRIKSLPWKK
jgi:hypothetical protein